MANAGRSTIWYHWNRFKREIEEREVISASEFFVTPSPIPTEWNKNPEPRREAKDGEWFPTRAEAVQAVLDNLTRETNNAADEYSRANQRLQEFRKKENLR